MGLSCFSCFGWKKAAKKNGSKKESAASRKGRESTSKSDHQKFSESTNCKTDPSKGNIAAEAFTFRTLAAATKNFTPDWLLGEGGFGRVYKGCLEKTKQIVAVKQLDRNGLQGNKEFVVEVQMLSLLHHQNLVKLVGYCSDGDQRLLVYEFMPKGSLEDHLFDLPPNEKPLDWHTRMEIASGAAYGIEYLHEKANPPVIYCDLKSSNILLDDEFTPKLSDFGLAKLGPVGNQVQGYCAPEYERTGELTQKSDVYSFGVVLLELISGRRAMDPTRPINEQGLVTWAQPMFKDQKRFPELVDPLLQEHYPKKALNQAVAVAAMCLQEEASVRPLMADVVMTLSFLSTDDNAEGPTATAQLSSPPEAPKDAPEDSASSIGSETDDEESDEDAASRSKHGGSSSSLRETE